MQSLIIDILTGWMRHGLSTVSGVLIARGLLTEAQAAELITGILAALVAAGLTAWSKFRARRLVNTALATDPNTTLDVVKLRIQANQGAPALSRTDTVPVIPPDAAAIEADAVAEIQPPPPTKKPAKPRRK